MKLPAKIAKESRKYDRPIITALFLLSTKSRVTAGNSLLLVAAKQEFTATAPIAAFNVYE